MSADTASCCSYNFIQLGFNGYKNVMEDDLKNARLFSRALENSKYYEVLSDIHRPAKSIGGMAVKAGLSGETASSYEPGLPVVAFRWTDEFKAKHPHLKQSWMQKLLRVKGWIIPVSSRFAGERRIWIAWIAECYCCKLWTELPPVCADGRCGDSAHRGARELVGGYD